MGKGEGRNEREERGIETGPVEDRGKEAAFLYLCVSRDVRCCLVFVY